MPIPAIVGLSSSATTSATAIASQAASPFAKLLGQAAQAGAAGASSIAAAKSGPQQNAANALNSFNSQLQKLLAADGVDTSQPIVLKSDGLGGLELANDHPDSLKIKSILAENPNLAAQFASVQQAYLALQPTNLSAQSANLTFNITVSGQQAQANFS